jgi:DNA polymerase V
MLAQNKLSFFIPNTEGNLEMPYISSGIKAGFPSPAADFDGTSVSIDQIVVKNATATFYAKANGNSMIGAGIDDGDILVIDKSIEPQDGKIAVCFIDGEFTVKRIKVKENSLLLLPENPLFEPIEVTQENDFIIWGIVTYVVKKL